jgi:agmatine deiminase
MSGHRMVADFEPQRAMWLGWDPAFERLILDLAAVLKPHVALVFLVRDDEMRAAAMSALTRRGLAAAQLRFVVEPLAPFFVRDALVFTSDAAGNNGVVDFRWSQYGYPSWCARRHAGRRAQVAACAARVDPVPDRLERALADQLQLPLWHSALGLEGGGLEHNGQGLVIANYELLASRNPGRRREWMEAELLRLPGSKRVVWLEQGLAEDPLHRASISADYVGWGTGGHTDEFVRFADPRTVLLAWPDGTGAARHRVSGITRRRMERNLVRLQAVRLTDGSRLRIIKVPMPSPVERAVFLSAAADTAWSDQWTAEDFPVADRRRQGQRVMQIAIASWLNFVVANGVVVLPDYLAHGTPPDRQAQVKHLFESVFPGREVRFVDALDANWVGGGLHCATLSQGA